MQTFDYKVNDVMEHIIKTKVNEILDTACHTLRNDLENYRGFIRNFVGWYSSHERAKAVVLALPRNDAEVEGFINGLFTTVGDPT